MTNAIEPRLGHAAAHHKVKRHGAMMKSKQVLQVRSSSCSGSGLLYEQPASGVSIDSAKDTTIQWNPTCLDPAGGQIDIYLYAPQQPTANLPIHAWTHVPAAQGSFDVKLAPKWWNASASVELSLNIVPTGNQPWDTANPFGPTWTATYTAPTDGSKPPADAVVGSGENKLISIFYSGGHITAGGKAAAIICPLLVLFIAIGIFVRKMHINRNNKTADWAEHMDKRMSQISLDWNDGGDGRSGPMPGSRPASFMGRPSSAVVRPSLDHVRALYNANLAASGGSQTDLAEMSEAMDGQVPRASQYRASRISFAPSSEVASVHASTARSGHKTSASLPRVGTNSAYRGSSLRDSQFAVPKIDPRFQSRSRLATSTNLDDDDDEFVMSPTQEAGARPINADALRRSIDEEARNSMLAYPALEMVTNHGSELNLPESNMRHYSTAADSAYAPDAMVSDFDDAAEEERHSNHSGDMTITLSQQHPQAQTGMLPPNNLTSPDEAMRQYAAQRANGGASPLPGNTMRTLYNAATAQPNSIYMDTPVGGHRTQHSLEAPSTINEDDVVGYNEMIDHSRH